MKKIALLASVLALAACGQQKTPEPAPTETAAAEPVSTLPPPDQDTLRTVVGEACTGGKPIGKAVCQREGMTSENVSCDYAIGDDEYMRDTATLSPNADKTGWTLSDAGKTCTALGATPAETESQ